MTLLEQEILKAFQKALFESDPYAPLKYKDLAKIAAKIAMESIEKAWDAGFKERDEINHRDYSEEEHKMVLRSKEKWIKDNIGTE